MNRGWGLIEVMIMVIFAAVTVSVITVFTITIGDIYNRSEMALFDIEAASGFFEAVKRDVRNAKTVQVSKNRLAIDGTIVWTFNNNSVVRKASDERGYMEAFESVRFARDGDLIEISITLRRRHEDSPFDPVWTTFVYGPNLK